MFLCALIFFVGLFIYLLFWRGLRQKLTDEKEKINFLESKFLYLKWKKIDKETSSNQKEFSELLEEWRKHKGKKKGEIIQVDSNLPFSKKKPWKVIVTIKSGTWPFDNEDTMEIFSILDKDLENLKEYINYEYKKINYSRNFFIVIVFS